MAALAEDDATVDDADAEPPQESALRLSLLGDEAHVGLFLLAGWAKREARGCNWERVDEGAAGDAAVDAERRRGDEEEHRGVVVVEIPSSDAAPRASCALFEPNETWSGRWAARRRGDDGGPKPVEAPADAAAEAATRRRVDALVATLFRLVARDGGGGAAPAGGTARAFELEVLNACTTELAEHLQAPSGARRFVEALNRQRTRMVDVGAAYPFLAGLLLTALDRCMRLRDVDSILVSMMLAQSFYRSRTGGGDAPAARREYLKSAIQTHPVWGDALFWREALALCVSKQNAHRAAPGDDPDAGDDPGCSPGLFAALFYGAADDGKAAAADALWSQLGGIVHAMHEFGVAPDAIVAFLDAVCAEHAIDGERKRILADHVEAMIREGAS
ncbi:hypothetical protein JL722_12849 [Aureococcus anophagefferens]|nr:hypothetical protein JL722_12849 [Aureococcus anophagefferens]